MLAFNSLVIVGTLAAAGLIWTANDTLSDTRRVVIHGGDADSTSQPRTPPDFNRVATSHLP